MKRIFPIIAGAALLLAAAMVHAASPGLGTSGTQSSGNPGAIGGTQQSLQPTNPSGSTGLNPTAPRVDTSPGTIGGPSYNPSSEGPSGADTNSGTLGTGSSGG